MSRKFGLPGRIIYVDATANALTAQDLSVLQQAEAVFYDESVPLAILREIPISSQVVDVSRSGLSEQQLNERLNSLADEGKTVIRLSAPASKVVAA